MHTHDKVMQAEKWVQKYFHVPVIKNTDNKQK